MLGHFGVSQVVTFSVTAPLLMMTWFFFVGSLIDRYVMKRILKAR